MPSKIASLCATLGPMTSEHQREPEHKGSIWTHPYMIYIVLTVAIFGFLLFVGHLALENDWIPKRN